VEHRPERWLRIQASDTGRGIAPESLGKRFTAFERLDAAQAGFEGTGLALSQNLAQGMGGSLSVSSLPGKGNAFWIDLPTIDPGIVDHTTEDTEVLGLRGYPDPKRMLYVEDMVENVRLVEEILTRRPSITLIPAMLAGVALDLAREHRPGLILLDLHLPDMPGEQPLSPLRAEPGTRDIPVGAFSADLTRHHIDRLLAAATTREPVAPPPGVVRTTGRTAYSIDASSIFSEHWRDRT
jgi:CheY-like chemotaxis protein